MSSNIAWKYDRRSGLVLDSDGAKVCEAANPGDGALIAASPKLYKAAKRALNVLKAQGERVDSFNVLGALDDAIKQAEGRI